MSNITITAPARWMGPALAARRRDRRGAAGYPGRPRVQLHHQATDEDPRAKLARLQGSDRKRLRMLRDALADPLQDAWLLLPDDLRRRGQDAFRILSA